MREAGWHHRAQRHIRGGSSPAPLHPPPSPRSFSSILPPLCCRAEPALLPQLLLPLPKPGCSLRPLCLLVFSLFFILPFFSADVNRVASQSSLPLTHLIYKTTKEGENERIEKEESQNKMGTARSSSLFSSHDVCGVSGKKKNTFSKIPQFSQQHPDSGWQSRWFECRPIIHGCIVSVLGLQVMSPVKI